MADYAVEKAKKVLDGTYKAVTAVKLDDFATPDDNTDLNATTGRHGLLPKLSGTASQFLDGTGAFDSIAVGDLPSMTSAQLAGLITDETGTGSAVFATSPTITTPTFGNGTDNTHIEADGTLVFAGAATVWDDVNTGVAAAKTPASNTPDWSPFTTNTSAYTFKIDDYADLSTIEIPHNYKEGTDIEVHLHLATNGTNNETERKVKYTAYFSYGVPDSGTTQFSAEGSLTAELTIPANQPDKSVYYLTLGTITGTTLKIGTQLKLRIRRVAGTGTEPAGNPFLGQLGVHYQIDTVGSRTMAAK